MKIARIATVPFFLQNHLRQQICATVAAGHEVALISSSGLEVPLLAAIPGVRFYRIEIPRKISPLRDFLAFWELLKLFRRERFDIAHSTTPKAGILCAIAGLIARIPIRLHTYTGQPWMELHGVMRFLAKAGDLLTASLNTMNYADSFSQRGFLLEQRIVLEEKLTVLGSGSLAGVDIQRFDRTRFSDQLTNVLEQLEISEHSLVITFVGRLTRDKGISELVEAFTRLSCKNNYCVLLLIGPQEPMQDPLPLETLASIHKNPQIVEVGYSANPEKYLAITDIFCIPSYREGFGNVVIEAAAMGVPTVASDIVGLRDAVVNDVTGVLVPAKDVDALVSALDKLISNPQLRQQMGEHAKARTIKDFDSTKVNAEVLKEYNRLAHVYLRQPFL